MEPMCGTAHCLTDEELNAGLESLKTPELKEVEAEGRVEQAERAAKQAKDDSTRHERLLQFRSVMAQKRYLPEDVRDMMDKHLSMRDLLVLKRFGFEFPTNLFTRSKIRMRVVDAIDAYDKDWQTRHQGTREQIDENRKADEFQAIVDADTARVRAAYNPDVANAVTGGLFGAVGYGIGGDRGALVGATVDQVFMAVGSLPLAKSSPGPSSTRPAPPAEIYREEAVAADVPPEVTHAPSAPREKGEIVWAAMEQYGEKFAMDAGISPGDRIRLENRAATQTTKFRARMEAAGYQWVERTTPKEGWSGKWEPIPGKADVAAAARAKRDYDKNIAAIAQERNALRGDARAGFFARQTGPTTLDPNNLDFGPASRVLGPIDKPVEPDVTLPLAEPQRITRPGQAPPAVGLVGRHRHQPPRGSELISEHVGPGAQYRLVTEGPDGAIYDENQYEADKTRLERKEVSDYKTHKGEFSDNKRTEALKAKLARGERIDIVQDIVIPSVRQHFRAVDAVRGQRAPDSSK